ncbi:MAG: CopG family transcriptional regulator [Rubrivivax sp.]|nr:CopG family transcriptional regulator [Rubrivivax sp.]
MRTTLEIDDDVLQAAKDLARRQQLTAGQVISRLLRERLNGLGPEATVAEAAPAVNAAGFRPLPSRGVLVSNELVNALRDREGV